MTCPNLPSLLTFDPSSVSVFISSTHGSFSVSSSPNCSNNGWASHLATCHSCRSFTSVMTYSLPTVGFNRWAYSVSRRSETMRRGQFFFLKCGSGKQKNTFSKLPFLNKLGKYFIALVRMTEQLLYWPGFSFRWATMRSRTYSQTFCRISNPSTVLFGNAGERARVSPPKPHPTSRTSGRTFDAASNEEKSFFPPSLPPSSSFLNDGWSG
mmetsp:Transcript_10787/g.23397  ORF Transcript_10787/g.23397 Transcript_10787/m.23397 type:complete len:210 (-) Transcript_10787:178-807(-)